MMFCDGVLDCATGKKKLLLFHYLRTRTTENNMGVGTQMHSDLRPTIK